MKRLFSSWFAVALIAAAPLVTACAANEPDYEARVNESLETANLDDVNADWRAEEKQLRLSGEVQSAADRTRAEELARQVVGTSGQVVNDLKVAGTTGTAGTGDIAVPGAGNSMDDQLEDRLDQVFREDDEWDMDGLDLNFAAQNGVVTITGDAPSQAVKDRVTARVRKVDGVKDVVNNLEIQKR